MKLFFDEYDGVWVWVLDGDDGDELSPRFDEEMDAVHWQQTVRKIFTGKKSA